MNQFSCLLGESEKKTFWIGIFFTFILLDTQYLAAPAKKLANEKNTYLKTFGFYRVAIEVGVQKKIMN